MLNRASHIIRNFPKNCRNVKYFTSITCNKIGGSTAPLNTAKYSKPIQQYCTEKPTVHVVDSVLDHATYERVCMETLDGLNDYFELLLESVDSIPGSDIAYSVSLPFIIKLFYYITVSN